MADDVFAPSEPALHVRAIRPDEVHAAVQVWLAANQVRGVDSPERHRAIVVAQLSSAADIALVCVDAAGVVLGFVTGAPRQVGGVAAGGTAVPGALQLWSIFVSPDAQGRGVGSLLMRELLAEAERRGRPEVHLWVRTDNSGARRMYERFGFRAVGDPVMDGEVSITAYVRTPRACGSGL